MTRELVFETAPPNPLPVGIWECCCPCQSCVMGGPHEADGHATAETPDVWVERGSPDWPWRT